MNDNANTEYRFFSSIFLIISGFTLMALSCGEKFEVLQEEAREPDATVRLSAFTRRSYKPDGSAEWKLIAEEAFVYQEDSEESRIIAYNFEFIQFDEMGLEDLRVKGFRGDVDYENDMLYLEGGIEYIDSERTIRSEQMSYSMTEEILDTTEPVILVEEGLYTNCRGGIRVERKAERQICRMPAGHQDRIEGSSRADRAVDDEGELDGLFR